ncbi:7-deoxyloganetic acid glucosyltransferase-like [Cicer arietinum]|uniref:Glycosyltransferase n=1 Tax=Cicer arietinum TaxID=3827 RepID=A0A1S2YZZ3_CICAR|nr:7-deoxyloganetic acid glucosyltransferase-like [Cicer arietinum]
MEEKTMERKAEEKTCPHVLIFPCPAQGHVNSMLKLAELLALQNMNITFLNTEYIHNRLIRFNDSIQALSLTYPKFQFKTIPDFHDEEKHPGFGEKIGDVIMSLSLNGKPYLRDMIVSEVPKISCIILDGVFGDLVTDLASEFGIQLIHFRTISACCFWAYLCVPKLLESNEIPIRGDEDMDRIIRNAPGMENVLRCRDLPSFFRENKHNLSLDKLVVRTQQSFKANALILNTFEDLESPILSQIRLHFPKLYTIGPLHHHLNNTKKTTTTLINSNLFQVDRTCMTWLDSQPLKSVIYVSFGSTTPMKSEEVIEIWHGLMNSEKRFLWVIRPNMVQGKEVLLKELEEKTKERGLIVGWVPQEEVLAHKAIGAFLTHSGWNSTLESVVCGVPMICWPFFADQQINSRFVSEVWKIGLDMKDVCDRKVVENMVNDLMVNRKEEFLKSAMEMSKLSCKSVSPSGSSYDNFQALIWYIRSTNP